MYVCTGDKETEMLCLQCEKCKGTNPTEEQSKC